MQKPAYFKQIVFVNSQNSKIISFQFILILEIC